MTELRYLDLETRLIAPDDQIPRPVSLAYAIDDGPVELVPFHEARAWLDACVRLFAPGGVCVAFNGAAFDLPVLWRWGTGSLQAAIWRALAEGRVCDPMYTDRLVQHAVGRPAKAFRGLAACCEETLKVHVEKEGTWRLRYQELEGLPISAWPAEAVRYAVDDVEHLRRLHLEHVARGWIARNGGAGTYVRDMGDQCRAGFAFRLMGIPGVPVDEAHVETVWGPAWHRRLADYRAQAVAGGLVRPDGTRDAKALQAAAVAIEAATGKPWPRTDKGAYSTSEAACADGLAALGEAALDGPAGDAARALGAAQSYGATMTLIGDGRKKGRLAELRAGGRYSYRSRYDTIKETNRTGCGGLHGKKDLSALGGNFQNLPAEYDLPPALRLRHCFRAPPGWVFVDSDFAQLELYTLAQICLRTIGYSRLAEAILAGRDPHRVTGAAFLGISYDESLSMGKAFGQTRNRAKPFNFGVPGGMGAARFVSHAWEAYGVRMTEEEFRGDKALYFGAYPEVREYMRRQGNLTEVEVPISRFKRGGVAYCDACNTPFQSLGASAAKAATWAVVASAYHKQGELRALGAFPVAMIHDQVLSLAREDVAPQVAEIQTRLMETHGSRFTPDVPLRVETTICRSYNKGMDPRRDGAGRLVPGLVPGEEDPHRDQTLHGPWTLRAR